MHIFGNHWKWFWHRDAFLGMMKDGPSNGALLEWCCYVYRNHLQAFHASRVLNQIYLILIRWACGKNHAMFDFVTVAGRCMFCLVCLIPRITMQLLLTCQDVTVDSSSFPHPQIEELDLNQVMVLSLFSDLISSYYSAYTINYFLTESFDFKFLK